MATLMTQHPHRDEFVGQLFWFHPGKLPQPIESRPEQQSLLGAAVQSPHPQVLWAIASCWLRSVAPADPKLSATAPEPRRPKKDRRLTRAASERDTVSEMPAKRVSSSR